MTPPPYLHVGGEDGDGAKKYDIIMTFLSLFYHFSMTFLSLFYDFSMKKYDFFALQRSGGQKNTTLLVTNFL